MATRIKSPPKPLYEEDFYAWSKAQAGLLRAGRYAELDLEHLIEEVDDLGDALKRSVRNRLRTIMEHLLKLQHSPAQDPRSAWRATVRTQRIRLRDGLKASIRREVESELAELYADARALAEGALRDHGELAAADGLPAACPYSLDQISSDWLP
jgi:Domain of unknown function DUF29